MSGKDLQPMASIRRSRRPLLSSCALASAMVVLGHGGPAAAQSFQGTVLGTPTNATVDNSVAGQTTVTVTAPAAIVNWQPTDTAAGSTPITFQGAGNAIYQSTGGDYTVLNRIVPAGAAAGRSVLLNGTINSYIGNADSGQQGGAVWFYSPNGLVIGSQASIDVGSLLLTTRDLADSEFLTSNGVYNFGAADDSRSSVTIQAGAQINAASVTGNSYVAVVAPRIVQAGDVRTDGSAAYVAAEQATITMGGGLFDIQVQSGSAVDGGTPGDEVTLSHTGSTTGPALSSGGNPHSIYMVAIPKNVAISMLVGGTVGYDVNASVEDNGTVVLSAGSSVLSASSDDFFGGFSNGPASGVGASLTIDGGNFTSATLALARTDTLVQTGTSDSLTFANQLSLLAGRNAMLDIGDNATASVGGDLFIQTQNQNDAYMPGSLRGTAAINVGDGGSLSVSGSADVNATLFSFDAMAGFASLTAGEGADLSFGGLLSIQAEAFGVLSPGQGGDATLTLTGASLSAPTLSVVATGTGGIGLSGPAGTASSGTGGNARVMLTDASIFAEGPINVNASGMGGSSDGSSAANGPGVGGLAQFTATGATSVQGSSIIVDATGSGGFDATDGSGDGIGGGDGRGGTASFTYAGTDLSAGQLTVDASGTGTDGLSSNEAGINGGDGGSGTGGTATASIAAQASSIDNVRVNAAGVGGIGGTGSEIFDEFGYGTSTSPDGGNGGDAMGGTAQLVVANDLSASLIAVDAGATAGPSGTSDFGQQGNGANAQGGNATFNLLANASANPGGLTVSAAGLASDGGATGGNAIGGDVAIGVADGASLTPGDSLSITADGAGGLGNARGGDGTGGSFSAESSTLLLTARGVGGSASQGQASDIGGAATGGSVTLASTGGSVSVFEATLDASAQAGSSSGVGGDAAGGDVTLNLDGGQLSTSGAISLIASAFAGGGLSGGDALGGDIGIAFANSGSLLTPDGFSATADAIGGSGGYSGDGGDATGGDIDFTIADASTGTEIEVGYGIGFSANGVGGQSNDAFSGTGAGGNGGDGTGGRIAIRAGAGTIGAGFSIDLTASGSGGAVLYSGGNGGTGTGGDVTLDAGGAALNVGGINLDAGGSGGGAAEFGYGAGGNGGNATGGAARLLLAGGTIDTPGLTIDASASGGSGGDGGTNSILGDLPGGNGGDAASGLALLDIDGGTVTIGEGTTIDADAFGGDGGFSNIDTPPGAGGAATGGSGANGGALVNLRGGATLSTPDLSVSAIGFGGDGGYSLSETSGAPTGGDGGAGTGGLASVTIIGADLTASQAFIGAQGIGGDADVGSSDSPIPVSGSATGGTAELTISDGNAAFDTLAIDATASGGGYSFVTAGNAQGGDARFSISGGSLGVTESFSLDAYAQSLAGAGPVPTVMGGTASFSAVNGAAITFDPGNLRIDASALLFSNAVEAADFAVDSVPETFAGFAILGVGEGSATGGTATFSLDGAALDLAGLTVDAGAYVDPPGASAQGGTATATVSNGGALTVAGGVELLASGIATDGASDGTGQGGNGSGGNATLQLDGGSLVAGDIYLDARGRGGDSTLLTPGGDGTGGAITIDIASRTGQPASLDSRSLTAEADGIGGSALIDANGNSSGRDGGAGAGGTIAMTVGGTLTLAGGEGGSELSLSADGQGGDAFAGGTGGAGGGGSVTLATTASPGGAGSITASAITLAANGAGGAAIDPGIAVELPALDPTASNGGSGSGGAIILGAGGGDISAAGGIAASAIGTGQNGATAPVEFPTGAGGNGGDGAGGAFTLNLGGGNLAAPLSVAVNAIAGMGGNGSAGGNGGTGGDAAGGAFAINLTGTAVSFDLPGGLTLDLSAVAGGGGDAGDAASGPGAAGGDGGDAIGGSLSLAAIGGDLSLDSLYLDASATGGNGGRGGAGTTAGTDGAGGNGTGGAFDAQATGGTMTLGAVTVITNGFGGNSLSGAGGDGSGGSIRLATTDAPDGTAGRITALATSLSSNGAAGSGVVAGVANAGDIEISQASATPAGLIQFAALAATAQGGGSPTGISLLADGGTIAVTGDATVDSGGSARLSGINGGRIAIGTNLAVVAGAGVTAGGLSANTMTLTAADDVLFDGDVTGASRLTAQSTGGSILANAVTLTGGSGSGGLLQLLAPNGIDAPDAALITGGTAQFHLGDGDFIVGSLSVGDRIDTVSAGFGITSFGQLVSAGVIDIGAAIITDGSLDLQAGTDLTLGTAVAGNDILLSAPGAVSATSLTAGDDIVVDGGSIAIDSATTTGLGLDDETGYGGDGDGLGNVTMIADTDIGVTTTDAFGNIAYQAGGAITLGAGSAGGGILLTAGGAIDADSLTAVGTISASGGVIAIGTALSTGAGIGMVSDGDIALTNANAAGSLDLQAGADLTLGTAVAGNDILLSAPGAVSATSLTAGDDITVDGGSIAIGSATTTGLGLDDETGYGGDGLGNIVLTAAEAIAATDIDAFGTVLASNANGGIAIDTLRAGGDVLLSSSNGAVVVATDLATAGTINALGTDVSLRAIGDLALDGITATTGDIFVATGGSLDVRAADAAGALTLDSGGDVRLAATEAGGAINVVARGLATLADYVNAPTINVASYDIAIVGGEGPALIGQNSDSITLTNIGGGRSQVGGGDVAETWSLSNDEFGRLSAHTITLAAGGEGDGANMTIGQLDIIGAAGSDSGSRRRNLTGSDLLLRADGEMLVDGAVSLTNAGADDRLTLNAGDRILVDTATGAISVTGQGDALGGTLAMDAPIIFVGTAQAWTDISALSGIDAKNDRLGRNDGVSNPAGFLRANAMTFRASQGLYIQNTGTDTRPTAERAGFTVGAGGVTIVTVPSEGEPLEIVINGRQARADGSFATGADLIPLLTLQGGGEGSMVSFDPRSTANGCLIVGVSCLTDSPINTGIPQQDIINALDPDPDFDGETGLVPPLTPPIIQFADPIALSSDPVIEEPVTGTANENLWLGDSGGGTAIDQQVTGTRNDDDDQATPDNQPIGEQVTGTRNDSLDEQVTGTRNDARDEAEKPKP